LDLYSSGSYSNNNNNTTSYKRRATHQRKRQRLNEKRFLSSTIDEHSFENENRLNFISASLSKGNEPNRQLLKQHKILGDSTATTQLRTFDVHYNNFFNYHGNTLSEHVILEKFQEFGEFKVWYV
jgi:polyribonucleotide nucleotidyltransferase